MSPGFLPFVLIPLLVYTYLWINPYSMTSFMEGVAKYFAEVYLGYKQWKLELETKRAYRRYQNESRKLARKTGLSTNSVKAYFDAYKKEDWEFFFRIHKERHEARYKDFEDELRDMLAF